jgi:hypothetical protein
MKINARSVKIYARVSKGITYTNNLFKIVHFVISSAVENPRYISTALEMTRVQLKYV